MRKQKKIRTRRVLPQLILREKTFSPKRLRDVILLEYNVEMTPQAISMWLKRHPQIVEDLKSKIGEIDAQHENIRFERDYWFNDFHSRIPIIQQWIDTQIARKVSKRKIKDRVGYLKNICMGIKGRQDRHPEKICNWQLHPLALTEEKAMQYIVELNRRGYNDYAERLVIRNFLKYGKGEEPKKISGHKVFGKYGHIYAPKPKLTQILDYIEEKDSLIGKYCKALYKTATRANAMKQAQLSHLNEREKTLTVFDKGKRGQKFKWIKYMDDQLLHDLQPLMEEGKLFEDIDLEQVRKLCREAYERFIPKLAKEIPMPLHFWRHMFAQHMLRATKWNYTLVAMLGGWKDEKTLKDNYGIPPKKSLKNGDCNTFQKFRQ